MTLYVPAFFFENNKGEQQTVCSGGRGHGDKGLENREAADSGGAATSRFGRGRGRNFLSVRLKLPLITAASRGI